MLQFRKLVKKRWLSRIVKIKARSVRLDSLESCFEGMWDPPQKLPHGFLSLGHADVPFAIPLGRKSSLIPPGHLTSGILLRQHSTRISHSRNSIRSTFCLLRISHIQIRPTFWLLRISHIRILPPNGRGGRFNFPGKTCPDPLVAPTRRTSAVDNSASPDILAR